MQVLFRFVLFFPVKSKDMRYYKHFHYTEGQVLVGFGCWLHCRIGIGEGDAPRLIVAPCWEAPRCCAKASLFSERAVGMRARKESLLLSDVHLCWENKLASRSNGSNLP